ncbi:penicillin-binding protein activator LpoB [Campylobacter porcelli]|uniref:Penicillin-binding protein activator LpoB n=1 Tax=Campylobacter porcelli TaxID=1660073 RepID=A0A1X9SYP8_9BACT|nr:penicillin-binding protein activator LpoB [Campylobacter sp. RM6137]ARR01333.1 putative lipoprotein [Campylobacter sp. RM6137]MEE3705477.1 penicillin-binding protein activator LpoB [Campylobacter sp. CX2-8023-23]MEE3745212.1 penicillin-binding protein activator LpoB [Campylobacter sp. CX2-4855-23]MEE3777412.1 penicillin-binding protein activator LpoB [Campylobacter sp. CX2-4080-23]
MRKFALISVVVATLLLSGCTKQPFYTDNSGKINQGDTITLGLSNEDFELAAESMINSLLSDPAFVNQKPGVRKVVAMGRIVNDTALRLDTEKLTRKITQAMRRSGKFILTSAVASGGALDSMSEDVRGLRDNDEFNQKTIAKKGTLVSPDFSLFGKIRQDNIKLSNGKIKVEYLFLLGLTDLNSGLVYWEDEKTINKSGSNDSVSW